MRHKYYKNRATKIIEDIGDLFPSVVHDSDDPRYTVPGNSPPVSEKPVPTSSSSTPKTNWTHYAGSAAAGLADGLMRASPLGLASTAFMKVTGLSNPRILNPGEQEHLDKMKDANTPETQ